MYRLALVVASLGVASLLSLSTSPSDAGVPLATNTEGIVKLMKSPGCFALSADTRSVACVSEDTNGHTGSSWSLDVYTLPAGGEGLMDKKTVTSYGDADLEGSPSAAVTKVAGIMAAGAYVGASPVKLQKTSEVPKGEEGSIVTYLSPDGKSTLTCITTPQPDEVFMYDLVFEATAVGGGPSAKDTESEVEGSCATGYSKPYSIDSVAWLPPLLAFVVTLEYECGDDEDAGSGVTVLVLRSPAELRSESSSGSPPVGPSVPKSSGPPETVPAQAPAPTAP